jgi:hypothetical protein
MLLVWVLVAVICAFLGIAASLMFPEKWSFAVGLVVAFGSAFLFSLLWFSR